MQTIEEKKARTGFVKIQLLGTSFVPTVMIIKCMSGTKEV